MTNSDHAGEALLAHLAGETRGLMIRRSDGEVFEDRSFAARLASFPRVDPAEQKLLSLLRPPVSELDVGVAGTPGDHTKEPYGRRTGLPCVLGILVCGRAGPQGRETPSPSSS